MALFCGNMGRDFMVISCGIFACSDTFKNLGCGV